MVAGFAHALRLSGIAGAIYLAFVLVVVLLEVRVFGPSFGPLAFYSLTALFAIVTITIHWRTVSRKSLGFLSALIFVSFVFGLAVVIGVNAKFWMGGQL